MTFTGFATWMVVALLTGALAGIVAKDGSRGLIGDMSLSLGGSLLTSSIFHALSGALDTGWFVLAVVTFVGAVAAIAAQRAAWPRRAQAPSRGH